MSFLDCSSGDGEVFAHYITILEGRKMNRVA